MGNSSEPPSPQTIWSSRRCGNPSLSGISHASRVFSLTARRGALALRNVSWKWRFDVYYLTAQCLLCCCYLMYVSELATPCLSFVSIPCIFSSKKAVSDPMSLKWLLFVFIWQRGPLFNSKSLCHSELSRILTCVFQSMMPHLHTLLGRQSRWLHYGYIMAIMRQHRLLADFRKPDKFANV